MLASTWNDVDTTIADLLVPDEDVLSAALDACRTAGMPPHHISRPQGKMLSLFAEMVSAKRILEVGTLGGYSAIWLGRALPPDGVLLTLEINERHAEVARENLSRAGLEGRVEVRVGEAAKSLEALVAEAPAPFDLVFIDADKPNNVTYFTHALALSRPGTVILVDNVVRNGALADRDSTDPSVIGSRAVLEAMAKEPRVHATVIQTVGEKGYDGFALARVVS